jgi:hypothetical protein
MKDLSFEVLDLEEQVARSSKGENLKAKSNKLQLQLVKTDYLVLFV